MGFFHALTCSLVGSVLVLSKAVKPLGQSWPPFDV